MIGESDKQYSLPVYGISVAAELLGIGVQTLRMYESRGLVAPARTAGGTRRYSKRDLDRIDRVIVLLRDGVNLAGIAMVLNLQDENERLRNVRRDHKRQRNAKCQKLIG